jgi:hypothetical protein
MYGKRLSEGQVMRQAQRGSSPLAFLRGVRYNRGQEVWL